jgi:uncharacterized membrane protein YgdD (TMEM256/DUF423 family)
MERKKRFSKFFAGLGGMGVVCGAFGAHALKNHVNVQEMQTWSTSTFYLFVHVLAGLLSLQMLEKKSLSAPFFLCGILLFSGSLYTMVLTKLTILGLVTPVGGVLFLLGWFFLLLDLK